MILHDYCHLHYILCTNELLMRESPIRIYIFCFPPWVFIDFTSSAAAFLTYNYWSAMALKAKSPIDKGTLP